MPASSSQPAVRERRNATPEDSGGKSSGRKVPSAAVTAYRSNKTLILTAPAVAILCGLIVFLLLSYGSRDLPHSKVRPAVRSEAQQPAEVSAMPAPVSTPVESVAAPVETASFQLRRSRRYTDIAGLRCRVVRIDPHETSCDLLVRKDRKPSVRLRAYLDRPLELPSPDGAARMLLIDTITKTQVAGSVETTH